MACLHDTNQHRGAHYRAVPGQGWKRLNHDSLCRGVTACHPISFPVVLKGCWSFFIDSRGGGRWSQRPNSTRSAKFLSWNSETTRENKFSCCSPSKPAELLGDGLTHTQGLRLNDSPSFVVDVSGEVKAEPSSEGALRAGRMFPTWIQGPQDGRGRGSLDPTWGVGGIFLEKLPCQ